jgi:hypothetical protein
MHEWIPVVAGVLLHRARDARAGRWTRWLSVVIVAIAVVIATHELTIAPRALLLDLVLVCAGVVLSTYLPRLVRRQRALPSALAPHD